MHLNELAFIPEHLVILVLQLIIVITGLGGGRRVGSPGRSWLVSIMLIFLHLLVNEILGSPVAVRLPLQLSRHEFLNIDLVERVNLATSDLVGIRDSIATNISLGTPLTKVSRGDKLSLQSLGLIVVVLLRPNNDVLDCPSQELDWHWLDVLVELDVQGVLDAVFYHV